MAAASPAKSASTSKSGSKSPVGSASDAHAAARLDATWLARWGRLVQRRRWVILVASLVVAASVLSLFGAAGTYVVGGEPDASTEAGRERAAVQANLPDSAKPAFILILSDTNRLWSEDAFKQDVQAALAPVAADSRVASVVSAYSVPPSQASGLVSKDGHRVMAIVSINLDNVAAEKVYNEIRGLAKSDHLAIIGTGSLALGSDFQTVFGTDMPRTQTISLPLTLLVLVVVFGALVAALLPLAVGFVAVGAGIAITGFLANFLKLPDWSTQLVALIALGVAIDYCLFIVKRFREELDHGNDRATSLGRAMATSGHAVIFSGLTVAVSLGGLAFFDGLQFAAAGYAVAAAVGFTVLMAMSLLPAILALLGPRINRLHLGPKRKPDRVDSGFWHGLAGGVMKVPILFTVLTLVIVAVLASPLAGIRYAGFSPQQLPTSFESRQGFDLLASDFAHQGASESDAVLQWADGNPRSADHLGALWDVSQATLKLAHVAGVDSLATVVPNQSRDAFIQMFQDPNAPSPPGLMGGSIALVKVHVDVVADDPGSTQLVRDLRGLAHPAGSTLMVGGFAAQTVDTVDLIAARLPYAAAFIISSTLVILLVQVRSLVLPVKAVIMNLLSVAASFGLAVWIFQDGHFTDLLDFTPQGLEPGNLVLMFCIVFGLSMDYEVLLLSRMREAFLATGDNRAAVQRGLASSGRIITGAALIMVFVFGAFGTVRITFMKVIGIGLAFAVLFDATIIRALLVPSLMRLMGKWNWYAPRWMGGQPIDTPAPLAFTEKPLAFAQPKPLLARPMVSPRFTDPAVQEWFDGKGAR